MNSDLDVLKRLLKQFPIARLRDYFNVKNLGFEHVSKDILLNFSKIDIQKSR